MTLLNNYMINTVHLQQTTEQQKKPPEETTSKQCRVIYIGLSMSKSLQVLDSFALRTNLFRKNKLLGSKKVNLVKFMRAALTP